MIMPKVLSLALALLLQGTWLASAQEENHRHQHAQRRNAPEERRTHVTMTTRGAGRWKDRKGKMKSSSMKAGGMKSMKWGGMKNSMMKSMMKNKNKSMKMMGMSKGKGKGKGSK